MPWVFFVLLVILVAAFALVLAGRLPEVPQPTRERFISGLPPRPSASQIDQLRLPVVFRGYRMSDVDMALTVLRNRILELEQGTADPGQLSAPAPVAATGAGDPVVDTQAAPRSRFAPMIDEHPDA